MIRMPGCKISWGHCNLFLCTRFPTYYVVSLHFILALSLECYTWYLYLPLGEPSKKKLFKLGIFSQPGAGAHNAYPWAFDAIASFINDAPILSQNWLRRWHDNFKMLTHFSTSCPVSKLCPIFKMFTVFWKRLTRFQNFETESYILKAEKFAESAFQSQKSAKKVRKSRHKNFATKVRKSIKSLKIHHWKAKCIKTPRIC